MYPRETTIFTAVLITSLVLAIVITYFIIIFIKQHRRNRKLYNSKIKAEIALLENERKRIAADLHDDLGPLLSAVRMQLNCLNTDDSEDIRVVEKSKVHIDTILHRVREISNDLMPLVLLRKGLVVALQEFIANLGIKSPVIHFNSEPIAIFSKEIEIHLYRVLQEIIHNTIKHAKAKDLQIDLVLQKKALELYTKDDGEGFDAEAMMKNGTGLGLTNIVSRVDILRGEFTILSKPGLGVIYSIKIPI
ncbi:MAG: ATP-binding protein [Chitinophagaceae bacterium]